MGITKQPTPIALEITATSLMGTVGPATLQMTQRDTWGRTTPLPSPYTMVTAPHVATCMIVCDGIPQPDSNMGYVAQGRCYEEQKVTTLARVMLPSAGPLTQDTVTGDASGTIELNVYDLSEGEQLVSGPTSITCSTVVYDTYQIDSGWSADSTGYNFKHQFDGTALLEDAGHRYRIEYKIPTDEGNAYVVSIVTVDRVFGT